MDHNLVRNDVCQFLEWDSDFFGCRIGRVKSNQIDDESTQAVLQWCDRHTIDCLYFLADGSDDVTIRLAEDNHFHLVDVRVVFEQDLKNFQSATRQNSGFSFRLFQQEDLPILRALARVSFRNTRFYYDGHFPRERCDDLYDVWIEKSCNSDGDAVLVAESDGQPCGFITYKSNGNILGEIGLVGVGPGWQDRGLGYELVSESLSWFASQGIKKVKVVTQGRNRQAQRLYQRCGFLTDIVHIWYHRWFTTG